MVRPERRRRFHVDSVYGVKRPAALLFSGFKLGHLTAGRRCCPIRPFLPIDFLVWLLISSLCSYRHLSIGMNVVAVVAVVDVVADESDDFIWNFSLINHRIFDVFSLFWGEGGGPGRLGRCVGRFYFYSNSVAALPDSSFVCVSSLFLFFSSMKYGGRFFPLPFDIWFMFHFHFWENLGAKASRASRLMDGEASEWDNPFG